MKRRLNFRFLLLLCGACVVGGAGVHLTHRFQVGRNAKAMLNQADLAEKQGDLEKAEDYLSRYLAYRTRDAAVLARFGRLLEGRAKTPEDRLQVVQIYEKVLRRAPERRDVRRRLVDLAMDPSIAQTSEARSHLEILLESPGGDTERGELTYLLGLCDERDGKFDLALNSYESARKLAPGRVEIYPRLAGMLRAQSGSPRAWERADQVMNELIAVNGRSAEAYLERARYRKAYGDKRGQDKKEQTRAVTEDLNRALELAPDDARVLLEAAENSLDRGDTGQALERLERGAKAHPGDLPLWVRLSQVQGQAGRTDEAIKTLGQAAEQSPDDLKLRWLLADLMIQSGRPDDAAKVIDVLKGKNIRPELLGYLRARVLMAGKKWSEAAAAFDGVIPALDSQGQGETKGLTKRALVMLGECRSQLGNVDAAHEAYRRAVSIDLDPDPMWVPAHLGSASTLVLQNKLDAALDEYRVVLRSGRAPGAGLPLARLLIVRNFRLPAAERQWAEVDKVLGELDKLSPDSPEVSVLHAEALSGRGDDAGARKVLERSRDKFPERAETWTALAALATNAGKPEDGLAVLDAAGKRLGDTVDLRLARAGITASLGGKKAADALAALEPGAEKFSDSDRARLWRGLSEAYARAGATREADRLLARLAERDPNDLAVRLVQFDRAVAEGDEKAAVGFLRRIKEIEGPDGVLWRYAEAARKIQKAIKTPGDRATLAEARELLTVVTARRPSWSRAQSALAQVEDVDGNPEAAIKAYMRSILDLGERDPRVVRKAVRLLYDRGQFNQAAMVFQKLREDRTPISGDLQRMDADISMRTQDYGRALELAEGSVSETSDDYRELLWLGQIRAASGKPAESILRRAAGLPNADPQAWVPLVSYLVGSGQKEKAEAATREAESKLPAAKAPLVLAQCYELTGQNGRAGGLYEAALKARPDDPQTLRSVSTFYLRSGRPGDAKPLLSRIIASKGSTAADAGWATRALAGVAAYGGGHRGAQEALAILDASAKGAGGQVPTPESLRARARVLASQPTRAGRAAAIAVLEDLARRDAATPDDQYILAQLYEVNGDWPRARSVMTRLVGERRPNLNHVAYYASALIRHKALDAAQVYSTRLEQAAPGQRATVEVKARLLAARKKRGEAVALLQGFADKDPSQLPYTAGLLEDLGYAAEAEAMTRAIVARSKRPEDVLALAALLSRHGKAPEAVDLCDRAWKDCPPASVAGASVAILYRAAGDDQALSQRVATRIEEAIREHPDANSLRFDLANVRTLQRRYPDAEAILRGLREKMPENAAPLNNLAWMLALKDGDKSGALPLITRAIELDGERPDLLDTRAVVYMATGQANAAVRDLENATAVAPSAERYFHLARAYQMTGKLDDARDAFKKAGDLGLAVDRIHPLERESFRTLNESLTQR